MRERASGFINSIFFRITAVFTLCIIPLLVSQMGMYSWSTRVVRKELMDTAAANVTYLRDDFNSSISLISSQIQYLLNANDVTKFFVYSKTYSSNEYYENADRIFDLLSVAKDTNALIEAVRLYYPRAGVMLSVDKARSILFVSPEQSASRIQAFMSQGAGFCCIDGEYFVGTAKPYGEVTAEKLPAYYMEIILNEDELVTRLSSFGTTKNKRSLQYDHASGTMLFSDGRTPDSEDAARLKDALVRAENERVFTCSVRLQEGAYTLVASHSTLLHATFCQLLSTRDLEYIPSVFQRFIIGFIALCLSVIVVLCMCVHRQIAVPAHDLLRALGDTGKGRFDTRLNGGKLAAEYRALFARFNSMNQQIQSLITDNYEHTIRLQRAQFKQLQAQINPHFLYNSFFLLRHMVRADNRLACEKFLGCLGRYFQYITDNDSDTATLEEEYNHACDYLGIQKMRFEDVLKLEIDPLPEELRAFPMLRLTLQPLFENVLAHSRWEDGEKRQIRLRIENDACDLRLRVEDNGSGLRDEDIARVSAMLGEQAAFSETSGLTNIHQRLVLHYGPQGRLEVSRSELGGFCAAIVIPKKGGSGENE